MLTVIRDGQINVIGYKNLVVGDILQVKAGDTITADGIVVSGRLKVNVSSFSSKADLLQRETKKTPFVLAGEDFIATVELFVISLVLGSYIEEGSAKLLVLAVGWHTQYNSLQSPCEHHHVFIG